MSDQKIRKLSRRTILRGAGGAAIALPLLEAMGARRAQAATAPVKRFIVMFSANGTIPSAWTPTSNGPNETDFALSPILSPLEAHKADLVVISGLEQKGGGGDGHQNGIGGMLTGQTLNSGPFAGVGAAPAGWPTGPSVDQRIADGLAVPTKLRSLELGVQVGAADNWGRMIYRAANQPLPPDDDPASVYQRVFSDLHTDPAVLARLRRRRQSILDGVGTQLMRTSSRLGAADRQRLDAHLTAVREIETRLTTDLVVNNPSCRNPPIASVPAAANDGFPAAGALQLDLMVMALACDITRVASMQWSRSFSNHRPVWLGVKDGHHTLSHNTGMKAQMTTIARWYMQQAADLLADFKAVQEGGKPLLDNLLVVVCSELCTPWNHNAEPTPNLFFGKAGGAVPRPGRCVDFANQHDHNQFLTTICHAMGVTKVTKVGDLGMDGTLPGILT